jgi:hypothetical protein
MMDDGREKREEAKFQINNQVTNFKLQTITKSPNTKHQTPNTKQLRLSENLRMANWRQEERRS